MDILNDLGSTVTLQSFTDFLGPPGPQAEFVKGADVSCLLQLCQAQRLPATQKWLGREDSIMGGHLSCEYKREDGMDELDNTSIDPGF